MARYSPIHKRCEEITSRKCSRDAKGQLAGIYSWSASLQSNNACEHQSF